MIYFIHGNNRDKILTRSKELVEKSLKENLGALYFKFNIEDFQKAKLEELIGGRSLFREKFVVLCDGLLGDPEAQLFVSKMCIEMDSSDNIFILREGVINKKLLEIFDKTGSKIEEISLEKIDNFGYAGARGVKLRPGYEDFNIFKFTDALGVRDRKMAWILFQRGLRAGLPAEEIFWKVVWIFRNMILVSPINKNQDGLVSKLDIKSNTINNCRRFIQKHTNDSLLESYKRLVDVYHQFRRGRVECEMVLEQFILNL